MITHNADFLDRTALSQLLFAKCGNNVLIDSSVRLIGVENISIGNHVRIDAGAAIDVKGTALPGVIVGEGAVIGEHSLARTSVAPWTIHAGVPARYIRDRSRDLLALEAEILRAEGEHG